MNIYRIHNGEMIIGSALPIFINNGGYQSFTHLEVYQDGLINCWEMVDFEGFQRKLQEGWIQFAVPDHSVVDIYQLGSFKVEEGNFWRDAESLLNDVRDIIDELNDRPTPFQKCLTALEQYQKEPTDENKECLRKSYEKVPWHKVIYLGDMNTRELEIEEILYPEKY